MGINRRDLMAGTAAGAAASVAGAVRAEDKGQVAIESPQHYPKVDGKPLAHYDQARRVMADYELTGLIALNPVNIYYFTNTVPIGVKMRWQYPSFATFPREESAPTFLITTTAQLWDIVNGDRWVPDVVPYSGPANWSYYVGQEALPATEEPDAGRRAYQVDESATLNTREQAWADSQTRFQPSPTPEWALARALKESSITRGRVAVDDMRAAILLERIGMADDIELVDGDNIFRRIRYIKSPTEIELMRIAGGKNVDAAMAAINSLRPGMTYDEIERRFATEAAARGNETAFILAGVTLGLLPHGEIREGEPILVDAVSRFRQYHGDFARTVVVGEASREVRKRAKAQAAAREAALELARPGVRFSEIREAGFAAYRKAGSDPSALIVNPHSVGLQHTDHPYRDDTPFQVSEDLVLQAGMTITIDLPYIEVGFGAGHNEDLVLITDTGYELMHREEPTLIEV